MEIKDIKQLIDLMRRYGLTEFELEESGFKIRLRRDAHAGNGGKAGGPPQFVVETPLGLGAGVAAPVIPVAVAPLPASTTPPFPHPATSAPSGPIADEPGVQIIKSPMVGTFYRAANPEAKSFVEEGTVVQPDSVVCIIEAMKLMNEIHAEVKGTIVAVLAENGKPIEFGQPLFKVKVG